MALICEEELVVAVVFAGQAVDGGVEAGCTVALAAAGLGVEDDYSAIRTGSDAVVAIIIIAVVA